MMMQKNYIRSSLFPVTKEKQKKNTDSGKIHPKLDTFFKAEEEDEPGNNSDILPAGITRSIINTCTKKKKK